MDRDLLTQLDEWLANGDIDESIYHRLKDKYASKKGKDLPGKGTIRIRPRYNPARKRIDPFWLMTGILLLMVGIFLVFSLFGYEPFKSILDRISSSGLEVCCCLGGIIVLFVIGAAMLIHAWVKHRFRPGEAGLGILLMILSIILFLNTYTEIKVNWWIIAAFVIIFLGLLAIYRAFKQRERPPTWRERMHWDRWLEWD